MASDLTNQDDLNGAHEDDDGTGIYWFKSPDGRVEQIFVPRIKKSRFDELVDDLKSAGKQTLDAYRWVPERTATPEILVARRGGGKCKSDVDCVDSSCRCIKGRCLQKSQ